MFDWNRFLGDAVGTLPAVFNKPKPQTAAQAPAPQALPATSEPVWKKYLAPLGIGLVLVAGLVWALGKMRGGRA